MVAGDGPSVSPYGEIAFALDCKSCLRILASKLKSTDAGDRIHLVSALAVEETMNRGSATIAGIPGDQTEALRKTIRSAFRVSGSRCGTRVFNVDVVVWLEDDLPSERQVELAAELREVVASIAVDETLKQHGIERSDGRHGVEHRGLSAGRVGTMSHRCHDTTGNRWKQPEVTGNVKPTLTRLNGQNRRPWGCVGFMLVGLITRRSQVQILPPPPT